MKPKPLTKLSVNISDFNNEWNLSVLEMARKEREAIFRGPIRKEDHHREDRGDESPCSIVENRQPDCKTP